MVEKAVSVVIIIVTVLSIMAASNAMAQKDVGLYV